MRAELSEMPLWLWVMLIIVLLAQGTWLFLDARRQGAKYWFWGIWGLTSTPGPFIVYWIVVRKVFRKRR